MLPDTRTKILRSGRRLFAQLGYDGCTVDAVAQAAGMNKAMIYYHFRDKRRLYEAILVETLSGFLQRVRAAQQNADSGADRLDAFIHAFADNFTVNSGMGRMMLRELAGDGDRLPTAAQRLIGELIGELDAILGILYADRRDRPATLVFYLMIVGTMNIFTSTKAMRKRFSQAPSHMGFALEPAEAAAELSAILRASLADSREP